MKLRILIALVCVALIGIGIDYLCNLAGAPSAGPALALLAGIVFGFFFVACGGCAKKKRLPHLSVGKGFTGTIGDPSPNWQLARYWTYGTVATDDTFIISSGSPPTPPAPIDGEGRSS